MRTQTFIVSMTSALVFAGAAQATVAPFNFYTFDSFTVAQTMTDPAAAWASPAASQPIFGASGTREAWGYSNNGGTPSVSVGAGMATFASSTGMAGLTYRGNAQDMTNYIFSFYLNMTGFVAISAVAMEFSDGNAYAQYEVFYTGPGTYQVDLSEAPLSDHLTEFTAITSINIALRAGNNWANSLTMSNFGYVPAPGAAALIGLAGLVATRRRRN